MGKIMLVTGASSGMGREAAILLASGGHAVYAGARRAERMDDLSAHGITPVEMDVSKAEDMASDPKAASRGTDAKVLARVFVEAATAARPRRRYVKGATARPLMFIRKWFGDGIYESVLRRTFG